MREDIWKDYLDEIRETIEASLEELEKGQNTQLRQTSDDNTPGHTGQRYPRTR